jgi:ribosome modulation factor
MNTKQMAKHIRKCEQAQRIERAKQRQHQAYIWMLEGNGARAFEEGTNENPYPISETEERAAWLRGWNRAAKAAADTQQEVEA